MALRDDGALAVDAGSGLVQTVTTTSAKEADVGQVADLLHGKERSVYADPGDHGVANRVDRVDLKWHIAARPSGIAKMHEGRAKTRHQSEAHRKASSRSDGEHPYRVINRQFGLVKVRFRVMDRSTGRLLMLFAPANLRMARTRRIAMLGAVRPQAAPTRGTASKAHFRSLKKMNQSISPPQSASDAPGS